VKQLLVLAALLGGCAWLPQPRAPATTAPPVAMAAPEAPAADTSPDLLAYLARLRTMNDTQLTAEAGRQRRLGDDAARVRAAMALTLAHAEENEIVALVEPIARRASADADLRAMAGFLQVMAADRRRLRESAAAAGARLRDERKAQDALKQKADAALERAAQLQQKLDALTEIERSLSDRPTPNR
jgi:hypothetical protein